MKTFAPIPKFSRTPGDVEFLGPRHGQHNDEIYVDELGFSEEELAELESEEVI